MPKGYKPAGSGRKAKEEGNALLRAVTATVSNAEWDRIETARGGVERSVWIRAAILRELQPKHFYIETIRTERRDDGGTFESFTRKGDYATRDEAEAEAVRIRGVLIGDDNTAYQVAVVDGFFGYPE